MQELNEELLNSLNIYFSTLSKFGYVNYTDVNKLIVISFLQDIVEGLFTDLISEADYKVITNAINGLKGSSCLLPYKEYYREVSLKLKNNLLYPRITEEYMLRTSEYNNFRVIE